MKRFKSLLVVYELIGYKPARDCCGIAGRRQNRINKRGVKSLGEGIRVAAASGQLPETFTIAELKAVCPGWIAQSYISFCAHCVARNEGDPLKLARVSRGKYQILKPASLPPKSFLP